MSKVSIVSTLFIPFHEASSCKNKLLHKKKITQ